MSTDGNRLAPCLPMPTVAGSSAIFAPSRVIVGNNGAGTRWFHRVPTLQESGWRQPKRPLNRSFQGRFGPDFLDSWPCPAISPPNPARGVLAPFVLAEPENGSPKHQTI